MLPLLGQARYVKARPYSVSLNHYFCRSQTGRNHLHTQREEFPETPKSLSKLESCTPHHSTWAPKHSALSKVLSAFLVVQAKLSGKKGFHFLFGSFTSFFPPLPVDWLQLPGRRRHDGVRALSVVSVFQTAQSLRWPCVTGLRHSPARLAWGSFSPAFHLLPFCTVPCAAKTRLPSFHEGTNQSAAHTPLTSASPHSRQDWRDTTGSSISPSTVLPLGAFFFPI